MSRPKISAGTDNGGVGAAVNRTANRLPTTPPSPPDQGRTPASVLPWSVLRTMTDRLATPMIQDAELAFGDEAAGWPSCQTYARPVRSCVCQQYGLRTPGKIHDNLHAAVHWLRTQGAYMRSFHPQCFSATRYPCMSQECERPRAVSCSAARVVLTGVWPICVRVRPRERRWQLVGQLAERGRSGLSGWECACGERD